MLIRCHRGFTLIELMIVIAVIGIMATITVVSYNGTQAKARDARRKEDVARVADALSLYYSDNKNFVEVGSGCGNAGAGQGWLSYSDGNSSSYPRKITDCLMDGKHLEKQVSDPSGPDSGSSPTNKNYAYMKYHCGSGTSEKAYVYAKLETVAQSSTATDGTCNASLDTLYGMNYYVEVN